MADRDPSRGERPERTAAERQADHASLARLSETLVPALVQKLASSGLGELEVREGDWRVRLRRPMHASVTAHARRPERARAGHPGTAERDPGRSSRDPGGADGGSATSTLARPWDDPRPSDDPDAERRAIATSPAVGVFRPGASIGARVRAGDRIAIVDLLGIPQDVLAPIDGSLVDVFVQAGEAVEYGEAVAAVESEPPAAPAQPADDDAPAAGPDSGRGER